MVPYISACPSIKRRENPGAAAELTKAAYEEALKEISGLLDAPPGSPEAYRLEVLSILVEAYEEEHHPFEPPDSIEAIKFRLEQQGITITQRNNDSA